MSSSRNRGLSVSQPFGRRKPVRGHGEGESDDEGEATYIPGDDDFDVDVGGEGSKFSTSPSDDEIDRETNSRISRQRLNRPQSRQKLPTRAIKGKASKKTRRAVISDDDDDEDGNSMTWRSDTADGDPPSSPPQLQVTASPGPRTRKGKSRTDLGGTDPPKEDRPVTIGTKRPRPLDSEPAIDSKPTSPPIGPDVNIATGNKEPVARKKLPPIKKIKLSDSSASSPVPTSKAIATQTKAEKLRFTVDGSGLPPPPSSLPRKPAATAGNADLDLLNADVYKQLFSTGSAPPKSGFKEKEERMRELYRMRDEARAKRQREAVASFDLAAQHDKIEAFTEQLEVRRSPALWPNTLAAKFKADMQEKARAEQKAKQHLQSQSEPSTDRKNNSTTV